jgi:hypothetical protein
MLGFAVSRRPRRGCWHAPPLRQEILNHTFTVIALVRPIVEAVARRDRDLASQIRRAMSSVGLNLAEAFGTAGENARLRFETPIALEHLGNPDLVVPGGSESLN